MAEAQWTPWRRATERALYGEDGFYRRTSDSPRRHFRTSVHASRLFAGALVALARDAGLRTVVDVGAGRGELLATMAGLDASLDLVAVEVAPRPADLPGRVAWTDRVPAGLDALLVANEWLDNVPVDVVERADDGMHVVEVDPSGDERLGGAPAPGDLAWLDRWWPLTEAGQRAEVGAPRDAAWAGAVGSLHRGIALAVDYAHSRGSRPPHGSLTGYRLGRQVPPVPDGACDLTSHVALDACAAAGASAGATATLLTSQRAALHALDVRSRPADPRTASTDPTAYLTALRDTGEAAELTDPAGLGGFGWLVQAVGIPLPDRLRRPPVNPRPGAARTPPDRRTLR